MTGKLNAHTPAVTPSGDLKEYISTPFEIFSIVSPNNNGEILQACSTTSIPLIISPFESDNVFPCSSLIHLANFSLINIKIYLSVF